MKKKMFLSLILEFIILILLISFYAYAAIEHGLTVDNMPNLTPVGGINEATYTHIGRIIRRNNEGEVIYYISQTQYDAIETYLAEAWSCTTGKAEWWKCRNHGREGWDKLVEFGIFTYEDYDAISTVGEFKKNYLSKVKVTDVFDLEIRSQCTIGTLLSYFNNISSHPIRVLEKFTSIYCIKCRQRIPSWEDYFGGDEGDIHEDPYESSNTFKANDYIKEVTYDETNKRVTALAG